jgi:hypothetical protein
MSITENAVVKITIDDREARAALAAFERDKQRALAGGAGIGDRGSGIGGQVGHQALGRSAALVGATAPPTRSGAPVQIGGVAFPAGAVAYGDITRAMSALPQGTPSGQVMALARQYAGGAPAQTTERAGEQIVQREVEGLRRGMARGAQQAAAQAGTGAAAAAGGGGRPLFGGVLSGTSPLLSLGAFSFSAMALATGAIGAAGAASDAYRELRGVTAFDRSIEDRRTAAMRTIGERLEPARAWWEEVSTRVLESSAYSGGGAGLVSPRPPDGAPGPNLGDIAKPVTDALAEAGRQINGALGQLGIPADVDDSALGRALSRRMVREGAAAPPGETGVVTGTPAIFPLQRTPAQVYDFMQAQTRLAVGRRDLADQAAAIGRAQGAFAEDQARERLLLQRTIGRQAADLDTSFSRSARDLATSAARARRDLGVNLGDAYADLATQQGYGREDIERGYQRSVRGAVLSEVLPGGLTGALIGSAIQRQDALADLATGGARQAAQIGLGGARAMRDLGTRQGDALADLETRRADAFADLATSAQRAMTDLLENQRLASERFAEQIGLMVQKVNDTRASLDLFAKEIQTTTDDLDTLSKAHEEYRKSLRAGGEQIGAVSHWVTSTMPNT